MIREKLEDYVTTVPNFPEEGVMFRDITTILSDPDGLKLAVDTFADMVKDLEFDAVVGLESRGFMFGVPLAYNLHKPFRLRCPAVAPLA